MAALLAIVPFATLPAQAAQKVGVAAAVNPDAFAGGQVINLGKSLFFNQKVNTSANGLVQVLLVDGSTFTVGPNSNLTIDKFVYDPNKGEGEMVATFSKGARRFVGGKLSKKQGGVTVNTPQGALAIRGGIAQLQVNAGGSKFLFDFGDRMQLQGNDGQTHTIFQPGNTIDAAGGGSPFVRPTSPADTQFFLTQLSSKPGQSGGAGSGGGPSDGQTASGMGGQSAGNATPPPINNNETQTEIFTVKIEDATTDRIEQQIIQQIADTPPPPVVGDPLPVIDPVIDPPPPPPLGIEINLRVLSAPLAYTSFTDSEGDPDSRDFSPSLCEGDEPCDDNSPGAAGILGGDDFEPEQGGAGQVTSDDFVTTATLIEGPLNQGSLVGSVQLVSRSVVPNCEGACITTVLDPVKSFAFSFNTSFGDHEAAGVVFNVSGDVATLHDIYVGSQVHRDGFFAYQMYAVNTEAIPAPGEVPVIDTEIAEIDFNDPLLIVGGDEYVLPTGGQLHEISLRTDPRENQRGFVAPFASADFMPKGIDFPDEPEAIGPLPSVSDLLLLEQDGGAEDKSQSVWLQTSFYISSTGGNGQQQSFAVIALGGVEERNGFDALVGTRRGGSQTLQGPLTEPFVRQASFAGGVASLAGGDGAHLMGADGVNLVIGADSTGNGHEIFIDRPLVSAQQNPQNDRQYATYHIGTQDGAAVAVAQSSGNFEGYAVGIVQSLTLGQSNVVMSGEPSDVTFAFDAERNTLSAQFRVYDRGQDGATSAYQLGFGGIDASGKSAFIDNQRYAAIENAETTRVENGDLVYANTYAESWLASGDQLQVTNFFPAVFEETFEGSGVRPFCANCDFVKWGAWGTRVQFGSVEQASYDDNVHMGWWVAGDVTTPAQLDGLAQANMSATYNGHAIGNVIDGDQQRIGAGDLLMNWNFNARGGMFAVNNFDGTRNFGGEIGASESGGHFARALSGHNISSGDVRGSFINNSDAIARGVIGNFQVGGEGYRATGIFAGSGVPGAGQVSNQWSIVMRFQSTRRFSYLLPLAFAVLAPLPAHAQKVGVAAAVNQNALAGGQVVNIGKSVFYNQRVTTNAAGLVQVLLVDGSTFTVGPNSNLVIDKFVYDPARGRAEMTATVSKGVLRYVGGKISKNAGAVRIKTPDGQLGIRGGITQIAVGGQSKYLFDYGDLMQLFQRSGVTLSVYEPGNLIDASGAPYIRPATPEDIAFFLERLTSKPGQTGGSNNPPTAGEVVSGLGNQGADNLPQLLIDLLKDDPDHFQFRIEDATTDRILQIVAGQEQPVEPADPVQPDQPVEPVAPLPVFFGFAAGLYERFEDNGNGFGESPVNVDIVASEDANGVRFTFDPNGTISGPLTVNGPEGGAVLRYGNDPNASVVTVHGQTVQNLVLSTSITERTGQTGFCLSCDFIRWGGWTGEATFNLTGQSQQQRVVVDRGLWVAGDVTPAGDLPASGVANYAGDVIGVASDSFSGPQRDVAGTFGISWDFAARNGQFNGTFDERGFGGSVTQPHAAANLFSGSVTSANQDVDGFVRGSFVNAGGQAAGGAIGNFELRGIESQYRATGVFAGQRGVSN